MSPAAWRNIVFGTIATAIAILVWPTRYHYDHLKKGAQTYPVRIDRFSGRAEYFDGSWSNDDPPAPASVAATSDPLSGYAPGWRAASAAATAPYPDEAEFQAWKRAKLRDSACVSPSDSIIASLCAPKRGRSSADPLDDRLVQLAARRQLDSILATKPK